jgi:DNA-binding transcriptional LysR family regulator
MELGQTEAIKGAVAAGVGVAFLSRFAVAHEVACGMLAVARLEGVSLARDFFLVRLKDKRQSAVGLAFREVLEDERAGAKQPHQGRRGRSHSG